MSDKIERYKAGLKRFGADKHLEAIAEYKLALKIEPDWEDVLHALAMAYMSAGKFDDAIATGKRILELNPSDNLKARRNGVKMAKQINL
ncbi:MAG: tetratricopeptide (TPR) repeat protein [Candidatus Pelagisphaera sp.]|jgi:tetratricopeptide (TPR) repeat protein